MGMCGNDRKHSSKIMVQGVYLFLFHLFGPLLSVTFAKRCPSCKLSPLSCYSVIGKKLPVVFFAGYICS